MRPHDGASLFAPWVVETRLTARQITAVFAEAARLRNVSMIGHAKAAAMAALTDKSALSLPKQADSIGSHRTIHSTASADRVVQTIPRLNSARQVKTRNDGQPLLVLG